MLHLKLSKNKLILLTAKGLFKKFDCTQLSNISSIFET